MDDSGATSISGGAARLFADAKDLGPVPDATIIRRIQLVLKRSADKDRQLALLLQQQQDPASPNYHHWLTPSDFGQRFGPDASEVGKLTAWLTEKGFQSVKVNAGQTVVEFSGPASAIRSAFQTPLHRVSLAGGTYYANLMEASVPKAFTNLVAGVSSLNNLPRSKASGAQTYRRDRSTGRMTALSVSPTAATEVKPQFTYSNAGNTVFGIGPYDFAAIYDVAPLWNASSPIDGAGQSIAIAGDSFINPADFVNFRSLFSLPLGNTNTQTGTQYFSVVYNGPPPQNGDDEFHGDADTQWAAAVAKNATILYVTSESTEASSGVDLSAEYIVDNNLAAVLVDTFTSCELALGRSGNAFYNSLWQQAAAQGITVVTSAGDSGNAACDVSGGSPATHGVAQNGIASTPYDVSVGGTEFYAPNGVASYFSAANTVNQASAMGYIPEDVWNDSCTNPTILSQSPFNGSTPEQACNSPEAMADGLVTVTAGGGGASNCTSSDGSSAASCSSGYPKPSWQDVPGVPSDGVRDLPDVSFFASKGRLGAFYLVCDQDLDPSGTSCSLDSPYQNIQAGGGSEIAAAAFAGVMALAVEKTGERIGNPNILLYSLANKQASAGVSCNSTSSPDPTCLFHDVTVGANNMVCVSGTAGCVISTSGDTYGVLPTSQAAAGYDLASGLGSVDVANLVSSWMIVGSQASSAVLVIDPAQFTHGSPANVQVSVMGNAPTGTVAINAQVENGSVGTGSLSNGSFAGIFRNFPGGSYGVQAHYAGDANNEPSDSNFVSIKVSPEPSTTKLSVIDYDPATGSASSVATAPYGTNIYVRADVAGMSGVGTATGLVTFDDNGNQLTYGVYRLNSNSYTEAQENYFAVGGHLFTASYAGDASFNASQSGQLALTITRAPTTASVALSSSTVSAASTVTVTATVGTQSYSSDAAPTGNVIFMAGSQVLGSAAVTQGYAPNSTIRQSTVSATFSANTLAIGESDITVSYAGDMNYLPSSSSAASLTVTNTSLTATTTSLTVLPTVVGTQGSVTLSATILPNSPNPTGTVQFRIDGGDISAPVPVNGAGMASLSQSAAGLSIGQHQATAVYSGDASHYRSSASAPVVFTVRNQLQSVTTIAVTPTTAEKGTFISVAAKVAAATGPASPTPTGNVQLTLDGVAYGLALPLSNGVAKLPLVTTNLQVGVHTLSVYYQGDSVYAFSYAAAVNINILAPGLNPSAVVVSNLPAQEIVGNPLPFTASVTPTSPVPTGVYQIILDSGFPSAPILLAGAAQQLSVDTSGLSLGDHTLNLFYSGDSYYTSSVSATQTFTVTGIPMGATFTLTPASTTLSQSRLGVDPQVSLSLTAINGFNSMVNLSCSNLPVNTACAFSAPSISVSGNQAIQDPLTLQINTGVKGRPLVAKNSGVLPVVAFAGLLCLFVTKRRPRFRSVLLFLLLTGGMIFTSGCGSGYAAGLTPTGTYTITVTATSEGITQNATVTLTLF